MSRNDRPSFASKVEAGQRGAGIVLGWIFRVVVFVIFAPLAMRALIAGDMLALGLSLACGIGLGAMLAPPPE